MHNFSNLILKMRQSHILVSRKIVSPSFLPSSRQFLQLHFSYRTKVSYLTWYTMEAGGSYE